ncbi:unnamed protein product [Psylliodes chrysocephalus]|uniref:Regulatory protein zeste n=1 Tax=Psylliodes chrysocephalus TaxID=3402493 RepID=A0A9P0CL67_9CUCU|nr:unnamed protein product [Psylliodes chrysocephala]
MLHPKQLEVLIDFLEKNRDIVSGRAGGPNARNILKEKWQNIADVLNSLGYGSKTADKWLKTWTDMKYNLKKKASDIKKDQSKTGGGLGSTKILTPFEERAL